MIKSRKHQLLIALILICTSVPALGVEPSETIMGLNFEISSEKQKWQPRYSEIDEIPVKPTHDAELFLPDSEEYSPDSNPQRIMRMLKTSPGQSMSSDQHTFLSTSRARDAIAIMGRRGDKVPRHYQIRLYAVTEKDARKMAEAFIEALTDKAEKIRSYKDRIRGQQEGIFYTKEEILQTEASAEAALANLRDEKNMYYFSTDEAKQAVSELNKMLNNLDIELAGIQAKLLAVQEHRERQKSIRDKKLEEGISREGILLKLEDMWIDLLIELKVAQARKDMAIQLRRQAEIFCKEMNTKKAEFQKEVNGLKMRLTRCEQDIHQYEEKLADADFEMLPPMVYQNKVTIYPVGTDD